MSEVKRDPMITTDENGEELATFDGNHSLSDIARWIFKNRDDAEEFHRILGDMLAGTDGMVLQ
jgi:hypothetical protein